MHACRSTLEDPTIEAVVATGADVLYQLYWSGDRDAISARLERAARAGAKGLIVTLDWSFVHSRDWGSPPIPPRIDLRAGLMHAPELAAAPRWVGRWLAAGRIPQLLAPNAVGSGDPVPTFADAFRAWIATPLPTWDDVAWLREQWLGPFMVKGVMRVDEARRAVDAGATAISVSNHGGNNLDSVPSPLRVLPAIADAVGDRVEVVMDGGVRRGSDVVKAMCLGARAVMIGRASLWGLAANGQAGVENVLDVLRSGIDSTLLGIGRADVAALERADVRVPVGFARAPDPSPS